MRAFLAPERLTDQQYAELVGATEEYTFGWVKTNYGRAETVQELTERCNELALRELESALLEPLAGAADLIDALESSGRRLAVASQSPLPWVEASLRGIGLFDRFPVVVTAHDVARGKPAPDIYVHAAHRLGVAPKRCLAVEDSIAGVGAAVAADMLVVQLRQATHVAPPQRNAHLVIDMLSDFPLAWLEA
jgi:HAD superfamily hydrolase (TIGR01509 family)